jgi:hypothetical protein
MSAIMRKAVEGWGAKVIDRLSADFTLHFPEEVSWQYQGCMAC